MIVLRSKSFTKYDDTDSIKRMKDADILAENEKEVPSYTSAVLPKAAAGAAIGAVGLGAAAAGRRGFKALKAAGWNKRGLVNAAKGMGVGAKRGAIAGAAIGAILLGNKAAKKREQEREDAQFYNNRLKYAQRQALRREKTDWKKNMTQREGYSY